MRKVVTVYFESIYACVIVEAGKLPQTLSWKIKAQKLWLVQTLKTFLVRIWNSFKLVQLWTGIWWAQLGQCVTRCRLKANPDVIWSVVFQGQWRIKRCLLPESWSINALQHFLTRTILLNSCRIMLVFKGVYFWILRVVGINRRFLKLTTCPSVRKDARVNMLQPIAFWNLTQIRWDTRRNLLKKVCLSLLLWIFNFIIRVPQIDISI